MSRSFSFVPSLLIRTVFVFVMLWMPHTIHALSDFNGGAANFLSLHAERLELENGMIFLLHQDKTTPLVSFNQYLRVGSRNEKPGLTGLTHMLEHLMFKGSKNFKGEDIDQLLLSRAIVGNAFTNLDYTGFYSNFPSDQLEFVMRFESDRLSRLLLNEKILSKEKEVVKEERRWRVDNSVSGLAKEALFSLMYQEHPYKWPTIGWMEDIDKYSLSKVLEHYKTYYVPNNAVVAIVGDIDVSETKRLIQKYYSGARALPLPRQEIPTEPEQNEAREVTLAKPVSVPFFSLGYRTVACTSNDIFALEVLSGVLTGGTSSRLYKKLVYEAQNSVSVSSDNYSPLDEGFFSISVSIKPDRKISDVLLQVRKEIEAIQKNGVTERELQKVKNQFLKGYIDSLKTIDGKARTLIVSEILYRDHMKLFSNYEKYAEVSAEDVKRVAQKYLTAKRQNLVRVIPEGWRE